MTCKSLARTELSLLLRKYLAHGGNSAALALTDLDLAGTDLDDLLLERARLGDYTMRHGVNLQRASLHNVSLRYAELAYANLYGAKLRNADLTGIDAPYADFRYADLRNANLTDANLYKADLTGATLTGAKLTNADLHLTHLSATQFTRRELGGKLLHENPQALWQFVELIRIQRGRAMEMPQLPYQHQARIYRSLKVNWISIGNAQDASWAYVRERRSERAMRAPWRRAQFVHNSRRSLWLQRVIRPFHWTVDTLYWLSSWLADLTCGYGEHPWNALAVSLFIIVVFPLFYQVAGGIQTQLSPSFLDYWIYSLHSFTTIGASNYQAVNWQTDLLTGIESALGITLFALLMFSLGNRISRL